MSVSKVDAAKFNNELCCRNEDIMDMRIKRCNQSIFGLNHENWTMINVATLSRIPWIYHRCLSEPLGVHLLLEKAGYNKSV